MKPMPLYSYRWLVLYLPVMALAVLLLVGLTRQLMPPPPPTAVVLSAGQLGSSVSQLAEAYREDLEQRGVRVTADYRPNGVPSTYRRLVDPADAAQAGFVHGLNIDRTLRPGVQALAVVGKQPVWLFTHVSVGSRLADLKGRRIATGGPGGPSRPAVNIMLAHAHVSENEVTWIDGTKPLDMANQLIDHKIDALALIGTMDHPAVRLLLRSPEVDMVSVENVHALRARDPRLRPYVLPQGAIELRNQIPPHDVTLMYVQTYLMVKADTHPALQRLLLDAADRIHEVPNYLQRQDEYPDFINTDVPLSPTALAYAKADRPWLETLLPYRWAWWVQWFLMLALPLMLLTWALLRWIPTVFSLRVDSVLQQFYGELTFLESEIDKTATEYPIELRKMMSRLDAMDQDISNLHLPNRFADRWYRLREHVAYVRSRLMEARQH